MGAGDPEVILHPDPTVLAEAVAARLVTALVDAQAARGRAHVVLTGGTIGIEALAALATSPARAAVDWSAVDVWWGDERFVPAAHPDRNALQARQVLLDLLPLEPGRVHEMPPSDDPVTRGDVDAAAAAYARSLRDAAGDGGWVPAFDVLMLGVGPDGHVASLFPGHAEVEVTDRAVVAVRDSPKPPPARVSLTLSAIDAAQEVWLIAAGAAKEPVITAARTGDRRLPASRPRGTRRTLWLLDRAAAGA